jgi:hypothetical protein
MLPSLLYAVVLLLLDLARLRCRSSAARDLELLALRHEVGVLRRRTKRIAWCPGDRLVLAALSRFLPAPDGMRSRSGPRRSSAGTASWSAASGPRSAGAVGRGAPRSRPHLEP